MKTVKSIIEWLQKEKQGKTARDSVIFRGFYPTERYIVDFAPDFGEWLQYDTDQDAHYFGVWVNPVEFLTLTYAEGDWSLVICKDKDQFNAEIQSMNDYYGTGFICKTIGETGMTTYIQDRETFFVQKGGYNA